VVVFVPPGNGKREMSRRIKCPECGKGTMIEKIADLIGSRKGESFPVRMEALVCPKCNFKTVPRQSAAQFALRTANAYRQAHNLLTSMGIRDLRGGLKMTQRQFAEFLGVGVASVKRWELGEIQDVAMDRLMRLAAADRAGKRRSKYRPWGGFDQLGEKMAMEKYDPSSHGKGPLEVANGPPARGVSNSP
jgi:putative zinc finger/helix-turn-helix YgiT family protein